MCHLGLYSVISVPEWLLCHHIRSLLTVFDWFEYYLLRHRGALRWYVVIIIYCHSHMRSYFKVCHIDLLLLIIREGCRSS